MHKVKPPHIFLVCQLLFFGSLVAGCGSHNTLSGSVQLDLAFDTFVASTQGTQLLLSYTRKAGGKVAQLSYNTEGANLGNGTTVAGSDFLARAAVSRAMGDDSAFPDILQGSIYFDRFNMTKGEHLSGTFTMIFVKGSTLNGQFDADIAE
ncbi:MAG: hypothetical protein EOO40_09325 [Deltaproteobacteria bacterium]|nr:MAG: hypothetical protein EOO40_09325 [Deltaproteobacteria bacterium]